MQFRRIDELPPYVFATVDALKRRLRAEGRDVVDLGFGNPDIPSPLLVVEKLAEAAAKPSNPSTAPTAMLTGPRSAASDERSLGERGSATAY